MGPLFCPNCLERVHREHRICHRCGLNLQDRRVRPLNVGSVLWMSAVLAPLIPTALMLVIYTFSLVSNSSGTGVWDFWMILVCLAVVNPIGVWRHLRRRGLR